jgi:tetratricopeptide (TPR) repeat protein
VLVLFGLGDVARSSQEFAANQDASQAEISRLIQQLGDPDFAVRDRAQKELNRLGEKAYDALTVAANDSDLEIAARARYLLLSIKMPAARDSETDLVKETLKGYSNLSTTDQLWQIRTLMGLPECQGYRAACRLVHIEKSLTMSKFAAALVLSQWPIHSEGRTRMARAVDAELKRSGREAVQWLTLYAELVADPKSRLEDWREVVEQEESLFRGNPEKSGARVVAGLLYDLAYWESEYGDADEAQALFKRAEETAVATPNFYLDTAIFYRTRGKIDWAVAAYRALSASGHPSAIALAHSQLAEMYHDMGRNKEAVAAMDVILELVQSRKLPGIGELGYTREQALGRRHFFLACQATDQGDDEKYRAELAEALRNDPSELDALIATYRIPNLDKETRRKTTEMIEDAAEQLRLKAEESPDSGSAHNQFAWLVGNTTGDMQEALKHALRAVELRPDSGAYYDTLAHVYFYGLKDHEKAIEAQSRAVELMPYSGLIQKKYDVFRKAAARDQPGSDPL